MISNIVRFSISIVLKTKPILHAHVEIHFDAKWRTAPNFRINKIGFSIHHSEKRAFRSRAIRIRVCSRGRCIRNSEAALPQSRRTSLRSASEREREERDERISGPEGSKKGMVGNISVPSFKLSRGLSLSLYSSCLLFHSLASLRDDKFRVSRIKQQSAAAPLEPVARESVASICCWKQELCLNVLAKSTEVHRAVGDYLQLLLWQMF